MSQTPQPWERQEWERSKAWAVFQVYRDLGKDRTVAATQSALGAPASYRKQIDRWVSRNNWKERCRQYDNHCDQLNRAALQQAQREEYIRKFDQHKQTREKLAHGLINAGARILSILQHELTLRANQQTPMTPGEIAALYRASIVGFQIGFQLIDEVLKQELEGLSSGADVEEEIESSEDLEQMVKDYFKFIESL